MLESTVDSTRKPVIIYFNITNLKSYNERYGFERGDKLIKYVAQQLSQVFDDRLVSRFNADHFVVLAYLDEAQKKVDACYEISNRVEIGGMVCREITDRDYYHDPEQGDNVRGDRIQFEMAIMRPRRIAEDPPDDTTDFLWVRAYGAQAAELRQAIRKGSVLIINGAIQTRRSDTMFKHVCENCGHQIVKAGMATEIVPYQCEYLKNCGPAYEPEEIVDTKERYIPDV